MRLMMCGTHRTFTTLSFLALVVVSFLSLQGCTGGKPSFTTEYQAVFMDNGQVFFGKIENAGGNTPLLRDVYYIGRQTSPDGKEVKNILIKRGNEWHAPDYMYINRQHIVIIEPVSASSRVAALIKDAREQKQQPSASPQQ
jgi:hypothetical protein